MRRLKNTQILDSRYVEEGTISRILEIKDGELVEISRNEPKFDGNILRGTKSRRLFYKHEVIK